MGRSLGSSYSKTYDPRWLGLVWRVLGEAGKGSEEESTTMEQVGTRSKRVEIEGEEGLNRERKRSHHKGTLPTLLCWPLHDGPWKRGKSQACELLNRIARTTLVLLSQGKNGEFQILGARVLCQRLCAKT